MKTCGLVCCWRGGIVCSIGGEGDGCVSGQRSPEISVPTFLDQILVSVEVQRHGRVLNLRGRLAVKDIDLSTVDALV